MKKFNFLIVILCLILGSCKSVPKRNLETRNGVIAANFNLPPEKVENLRDKGLNEEEVIKFLIISKTTYLTTGEIYERFKKEENLADIGEEAGLSSENLKEKFNLIKENIEKY
ncbi:MAG: hypothetical protein ACQEQC_02415 [Elusimicrobiota bacterium]